MKEGCFVKIRRMEISDYDNVYQFWLSIPGMGINNIDDCRESIAKYLARNPTTSFIAESDSGELIGAILCGHDGRRGHISHTAVKPAERKQGVGFALVNAALDALRAEGIAKVTLTTFAKNEAGNAFWERQGFITSEDVIYRSKVINDNLTYEKNIYLKR
jgi:ribosomal protein S18 acetylase RimI-like enzyme